MTWVRLDSNYMDDPKLWDAGWEATVLWPGVLALLKENDGVLPDSILTGRYLARKMGCPLDVAEAGAEGIRSVGLLTFGLVSWKVHKGSVASREGWYSERWADHGNAPNSWTIGEISEDGSNLAEGSATLPKVPDTLPKVPDTLPNDSRARCGSVGMSVGSVGLSPDSTTSSAREPEQSVLVNPTIEGNPWAAEDEIVGVWVDLSARTKPPTGAVLDRLRAAFRAHIKAHSAEEVRLVVEYLATDAWWRGRSEKHSDDLYTSKPMGWLKWKSEESAVKFDSFVQAAEAWAARGRPVAPLPASEHWSGMSPAERDEWIKESRPVDEKCKWDKAAKCHRSLVTGKYHPLRGYFHGDMPWAREWCERRAELHPDDQASDPDKYADLMEKHNVAGPRERDAMGQWFINVDDEKTRWDEAQWRGE